ncbi:hypothetical protein G4228_019515 [Cervus hanglu yarkandensis]|nr:hypothetical protein G4228_019515 [Cervus hanglu yarkandensis]
MKAKEESEKAGLKLNKTVRLRLQFDYPPPGAPHCTSFWLLIDLNGCRVVTDLISLIRQRFGFSSGALLGLYLEGALLPPAEVGLFVGRNCPGPSSQVPNATGWKQSDPNSGRQVLCPPPNVTFPASLGRGWGRGEDLLSWKGARGRGMRGRGRGRGHAVPYVLFFFSYVLNRNADYQKQQQLNEMVTNSSTIIQNPIETHKKDYSLLPLLAAAPQVGEKIAFKLLELTSDYSPDVSDYKEGRILSHNPETEQVDIEILSSLPAMKEPGKFDLVYHNKNRAEVVEYAVTQEKRISVFWRELIDPRLIIESPSNT